ncbi:MAG: hypothetical protein C4534_10945 [Gaiellales bacterium]|nr:MAG: hypothetical protein C4534_10945 [Gaiellales bacterium]
MWTEILRTATDEEGKLPDAAGEIELPVRARRFNRNMILFLVACELFLIIIDATINYEAWVSVSGIRRMANIAREDGIGTWFMTIQTMLAGATLFVVYLVSKNSGARRRDYTSWLLLSLFFFLMAIDDASQVHERLGSAFRQYAEAGDSLPGRILDFFPSYSWQAFILPFFAIAGVLMFFFLWTRLRDNSGRFKLILALDCFIVAIFLDFIEGLDPGSRLNIFMKLVNNTSLSEDFVYHFAKVIEESLEMFAITLLLSTFFMHLARSVGSMRISFHTEARRSG